MASEILAKFGAVVKPTITPGALASGTGRISAVVDNTVARAPMALVFVRFKTGASAPTANTGVKVYLVRRSNDATTDLADDELGTTDAAVSVEPAQAELLDTIVVTAATATPYAKAVRAYDLPPKYSIVIWNGIGTALDGSVFALEIVPITLESQ